MRWLAVIPGGDSQQLIMMVAATLTGTCLGLLISAATNTQDQASTVVPIVLIPQIVMAGVIVTDMPGAAEFLAKLGVSGYWVHAARGRRRRTAAMVDHAAIVGDKSLLELFPGWPRVIAGSCQCVA